MQSSNQTAEKQTNADKNIIVEAIEDAKGVKITELEVSHLTSIADFIIIVSGTSNRHLQTIAESATTKAKSKGLEVLGVEGANNSEWIVADFGDIILHVMSPSAREFYNIEGLWDIETS